LFFYRGERVKVKICGILDLHTAKEATRAGADALGFVFARESKRYIEPQQAREIISALPRAVNTVGVFVNTPVQDIIQIADHCNLDVIQLHSDKEMHPCPGLNLPVIRCLRVKDRTDVDRIDSIKADAILLDTYHPDLAGGTGKPFNWTAARDIKRNIPLILAGGLNRHNVREAIETVRPCAVDVSSGVETGGVKDISKIRSFIRTVKEASL